MLVVEAIGTLFVVYQDGVKEQEIKKMECFTHKQFGANVRARELAEARVVSYTDSKKIIDTSNAIASVVFQSSEEKFLNGVFFFRNKTNALFKLEKLLKKYPTPGMVELAYFRNVPKSEQHTKKQGDIK